MIERTFRAPNRQLNTFREALQSLLESSIIAENILVYAVDSTSESVEAALQSYDNRKDELQKAHQRTDDDGRKYFRTQPGGHQVRVSERGGAEIEYPAIIDNDPGAVVPDDPEMTWAPAREAPVQVGQLQLQFTGDEAKTAYVEGMKEVGDIQSGATLFLVPEETFYTSDEVDVSALQSNGLYRITRRLVVEGNQDWLDRLEEEGKEDEA